MHRRGSVQLDQDTGYCGERPNCSNHCPCECHHDRGITAVISFIKMRRNARRSYREIADDLMEAGYYPPHGQKWHPTQIRRYALIGFDLQSPRKNQIYVARRERDGAIKIGTSSNPRKRVDSLSAPANGNGYTALLFSIEGDRELERELHRRFAAHCIVGEWFHEQGDLAVWIQEHGA